MSVDSMMSMLNPVIAAVLRSPLHRLVSPGLLLLDDVSGPPDTTG